MYNIGLIIKNERERQRISQAMLCEGICSVSSLSRIENDIQVPNYDIAKALIEKLGLSDAIGAEFVNAQEYEHRLLEIKIERLISQREYVKAFELCEDSKEDFLLSPLRKQKFLVYEACYLCYEKCDYEKVIESVTDAIHITFSDYKENKTINHLLTDTEIHGINLLACARFHNGERLPAINTLNKLIEALEDANEIIDDRINLYPMLLCNISKWFVSTSRNEEAENAIKKGIKLCRLTGKYRTLPFFYSLNAQIYESEDKDIETVICEYAKAYIMFESMGLISDAEKLRRFVDEKFNRDVKMIYVK